MAEPNRCAKCRNQAKAKPTYGRDPRLGVRRGIEGWYVRCENPVLCSQGRTMRTMSGAIRVWNKENPK